LNGALQLVAVNALPYSLSFGPDFSCCLALCFVHVLDTIDKPLRRICATYIASATALVRQPLCGHSDIFSCTELTFRRCLFHKPLRCNPTTATDTASATTLIRQPLESHKWRWRSDVLFLQSDVTCRLPPGTVNQPTALE
ncbi:unnamed protein product, partial [Laminaria digitata]